MDVIVKLCNSADDIFKYELDVDFSKNAYLVYISTDLTESYDHLLSNINEIDESIDISLQVFEDKKSINAFTYFKNNENELVQNADYVSFDCDMIKAFQYINNNPVLKSKKIILDNIEELDPKYIDIVETYCDDTSNIYFKLSGNTKTIQFAEYKATLLKIDEMVNEVTSLNLSPIETIMYLYDMVRDKVYNLADEDDDISVSRDLTSALLTDKIVCAGYTNIYRTLLSRLGIDSREIHLEKKNTNLGHVRTEIYVKDDKYNIDGVYYFDPTWDSKKSDNSNSFLDSYRFFALTKSQIDEIENGKYTCSTFPYFSKNIVKQFDLSVENNDFRKLSTRMIESINHMSTTVSDERLLPFNNPKLFEMLPNAYKPDKDIIKEQLIKVVEKFNKPLTAETLLMVLYNVRKIQYYINPQKYPFDLNAFYRAVVISKWNFEYDASLVNFAAIFGIKVNEMEQKLDQFRKFISETELDRDIKRVKLTKTLSLINEQKNSSNNSIK